MSHTTKMVELYGGPADGEVVDSGNYQVVLVPAKRVLPDRQVRRGVAKYEYSVSSGRHEYLETKWTEKEM